jgi:hypothetical protein
MNGRIASTCADSSTSCSMIGLVGLFSALRVTGG